MARKNLNDLLSNDRSVVRAAKGEPTYINSDTDDGWDDPVSDKISYLPSKIDKVFKSDATQVFTEKCYTTHPHLKLGKGILIGGSAQFPQAMGAFAYIAFDGFSPTIPSYDYLTKPAPHAIKHSITDMQAPDKPEEFKTLVNWTVDRLNEGKVLHCGCIGGHGRTGTFIAAVVKEILGEEDAITWTRKNYCVKAVESKAQSDFLHKHFGIKPQAGAKAPTAHKAEPKAAKPKANKNSAVFLPIGGRYDIFKP